MRPLPKLLLRLAILASPLALSFVGYFVFDPFKVLRPYAHYYDEDPVNLNRDFVSTEEFLKKRGPTQPNAFIFGNSRSLVFRCNDWRAHLPSDARPFHFDAWLESTFGLRTKIEYLDARGVELRDVLIVLDAQLLPLTTNLYSPLFVKHPEVTGESELAFQALFAGSFFKHSFFVKYYDWKAWRTIRPYMLDVFDPKPLRQLAATNDILFQGYEDELATDGEDAYYSRRPILFKRREPGMSPPQVGPAQVAELARIGETLRRRQTRVRVIVSPLFGQMQLHTDDRAALERTFGKENVFDFSGVNRFTENPRHFYEESHYRPEIARELLVIAYAAPKARE